MAEETARTGEDIPEGLESNPDMKEGAGIQGTSPAPDRQDAGPKPVKFESIEVPGGEQPASGNVDLIMDIPLPVTVELGRTTMLIRDILELGPGSVVELDKVAGEPVDIMVNGKLVARGEVVVIDDNFGVRVVDIVAPGQGATRGR